MEAPKSCSIDGHNTISIVVKLVLPLSDVKTIQLCMKSYDTAWHVKSLIDIKENINPKQQFLIQNGTSLEDYKSLASNKVENGSILYDFIEPMCPKTPCQSVTEMIVKAPGSKPVLMEMQPWYTARHVKAFMQSLTGLMMFDKFSLKHGKKILSDNDCIDFSLKTLPIYLVVTPALASIVDLDSVVTLLEQDYASINITFVGCGWEEDLWVSNFSTVYDLKKIIEKIADIGVNQQTLVHEKNMVRLDEVNETLEFYGLNDGSKIYVLGLSPKFSINIPQVRDTLSFPVKGIKYVSDIKDSIFEKFGIPNSSQNLVYHGHLLDDYDTVEAGYDTEKNSMLYAIIGSDDHRKEVSLDIGHLGTRYCDIKVKLWYTILDLKTVIESRIGIPICVQELLHQDQKLKDWKHVSDYNLKNMDKVHLELKDSPLRLVIGVGGQGQGDKKKNENNYILMMAKLTDTIDEILSRIREGEIHKISGQPCLFLDNDALQGNKMLAQYDIVLSNTHLLSLDKLVQINVTGADGTIIKVNLKPSFDIKTVKQKIEQICGIPYALQKLSYLIDDELEYEVEDRQTLAHFEATLGSLWDLRWNFGGRFWSFFWPSYRSYMLGA